MSDDVFSLANWCAIVSSLVATSAALLAGCGGGLGCPDSDRESAVRDASTVYQFGCDHDQDCSDSRFVCWNEAATELPKALDRGDRFVVRDRSRQTIGGFDTNVWVVEGDGSGVYYDKGASGDVAPAPSCLTEQENFDSIIRKNDGTIELRTGSDSWRSIADIRADSSRCSARRGPPGESPGRWVEQVEGAEADLASSVAFDEPNRVYVGGFHPSYSENGNERNGEIRVSRYDDSGTVSWTELFGTASDERFGGLHVGPNGSVYVVGQTRGELGELVSSSNDSAAFVARLSASDGRPDWIRRFGGSDSFARDVSVGDSGEVYVTTSGRYGRREGAIYRFDSSGTFEWQSGGDGGFEAVAIDDGSVYAAGQSNDLVVARFDSSGNEMWSKTFGNSDEERATSLAVGASGVYVTGWAKNGLDGKTSGDTRDDGFVLSLSQTGDRNWLSAVTTDRADAVEDVAIGSGGTVEAVGSVSGTLGEDAPHLGRTNGFRAEFDGSGKRTKTELIAVPQQDAVTGLTIAPDGSRYVVGRHSGRWTRSGPPEVEDSDFRRRGYVGRLN